MYNSSYDGYEQQGRSPRRNQSRSKYRKGRRRGPVAQPWMVVTLVALLAVLIVVALVLGMKGCSAQGSIEGRWDLDGATVYEFYPDGKGALVLTTMTFDFEYSIKGNKVAIDFTDERASDAEYEFTSSDDMLMLTGGPGEGQTQHILKRDK